MLGWAQHWVSHYESDFIKGLGDGDGLKNAITNKWNLDVKHVIKGLRDGDRLKNAITKKWNLDVKHVIENNRIIIPRNYQCSYQCN